MTVCKLCFKEESTISASWDNVEVVVKIHFPLIYQKIIGEVSETDPLICGQCWKTLKDFNAFHKVVEKIYSGLCEAPMDEFPENTVTSWDTINSEQTVQVFKLEEIEVKQKKPKVTLESVASIRERRPRKARGDATQEIVFAEPSEHDEEDKKSGDSEEGGEEDNIPSAYDRDKHWEFDEEIDLNTIPTITRGNRPRRSKPGSDILHEFEFQELKYNQIPKIYDPERGEHDKIITDFLKITCQRCPESNFKNFTELTYHYWTTHTNQTHHLFARSKNIFVMCCNRKFYAKTRLAEHIKLHLNPNAYQCSICKANYTSYVALKKHVDAHNNPPVEREFRPTYKVKKYKCTTCLKTYKTSSSLAFHKIQHMSSSQLKYNCDLCDKRFPTLILMTKHLRDHRSPTDQHICDYCGMILKNSSNLKNHRLKHEDPEAYHAKVQCELCSKLVKNGSHYRKHMRDHRDEHKLKKCPHCPKISPNESARQNHIRRVHILKKTHKCRFCEKAFKLPKELEDHESTHTGNSKYHCSICFKKFNCKSNIYGHKRRMHPEESKKKQETTELPDSEETNTVLKQQIE